MNQLQELAELFPKLPRLNQIALAKRLEWLEIARPNQIAPDDYINLFWCCGRGFGKSRAAAEETWYKGWDNPNWRIGVIAPTFGDARTVCFEGESGLLNCCPPELVESYNKSNLELKLINGTQIFGYSTDDANRFRGPQHHFLWCEEMSSWNNPQEAWDMSAFGLRLGDRPQRVITSTPKPIQLVRDVIQNPKTCVIRGSTYDNKQNLPDSFFDELQKYEGTTIGRQELYGEVIDLEEMGIFKRSGFKIWSKSKPLPKFDLVVQSWDTAFSEKSTADYTAFTAWGLWKSTEGSNIYSALLLDFWQDQINFPDMRKAAMREYETKYGENDRSVDIVIIEKKASGQSLIQEMRVAGITVYAFDPGSSDKVQRAHLVSHLVQTGLVWLPESHKPTRVGQPCDWAVPLLDQACYFPNAPHDDAVDSMVQFLTYMAKAGWMRGSTLPPRESYWRRNMNKTTVYG